MNFKLIEKLEHTTPACAACHGTTHFIPGIAYRILECDTCGQSFRAPASLTRTIVAAYNLPPKNTTQKRIQPCILEA